MMRYKPYLFTGLGFIIGSLILVGVLGTGLSFAGTSNTSSLNANVNVGYAVYISIQTNTATFGNVYPGTSYNTNVPITVHDDGGNLAANILVSGVDWAGPGTNTIGVGNTLYSATSLASYNGIALSGTLANSLSTIAQPTITFNSPSNSVYFGVDIPAGTAAGLYTQTLTFENDNFSNTITSNTATATLTANVQGVCYISLSPSSIAFGSIAPNANVPTNVLVTDTDTNGNAAANVLVEGTGWSGTTPFGVGNTMYDASSQTTYTGTALTNSLTSTGITISAPTQASPSTNSLIYFGLGIPAGTTAGAYTQTITLENSC